LAGLFRAGFPAAFVSNAVMTGFLNGVAVLIILGQLGDLTGYRSAFSNNVVRSLDLLLNIGQVNVQATIIGLVTLGGIVLLLATPLRKFAFIIAIVVATLLLTILMLPVMPTAAGFDSSSRSAMLPRFPFAAQRVRPKPA
jgi:SulP family sulfate permease